MIKGKIVSFMREVPVILECLLLSTSLCHALKDRPVLALGSLQAVAMAGDGLTTVKLTHRPGNWQETAFPSRLLIGPKPTWPRMAGVGVAVVVGQLWLAERLKHSRSRWVRRLWWAPMALGIAANTGGMIHNSTQR